MPIGFLLERERPSHIDKPCGPAVITIVFMGICPQKIMNVSANVKGCRKPYKIC